MKKAFTQKYPAFTGLTNLMTGSRGLLGNIKDDDSISFTGTATGLRITCGVEDYELFNSNSVRIRQWSWNYRGCWHQTCPPLVPCAGFKVSLIVSRMAKANLMLKFVATSTIL
jgi:hypothetical protein